MDIIMVRHGQTEDNLERIFSRDNTKLTEKGRKEILDSKKILEELSYENIYYSPLTRTVESMETLGLEGIKEDRIREINFGIFTGKTFKEISKLYPLESQRWVEDPINYRIPKGENVLDVYHRIEMFLRKLINENKNTLLICHDCVIRLALCWIFENPEYFFKFKIDNGSVNIISIEDNFKYIKQINYKQPLK